MVKRKVKRRMILRPRGILVLSSLVVALAIGGCAAAAVAYFFDKAPEHASVEDTDAGTTDKAADEEKAAKADERLDPLVLVNAEHALPDGWEDKLELVDTVNSKGETVSIDKMANEPFLELQADLAAQGVTCELNSGYRSVEEQQELYDSFLTLYGQDYVNTYVAAPGHSEHHTGIAFDIFITVDGVPQLTNEEIFAQSAVWDVIHKTMPEYGFILRYPQDKVDVTGIAYEPWHLRYVGKEAAQEIYEQGLALEEYLEPQSTDQQDV